MEDAVALAVAHACWPMVRQVYAHAVFRPAEGAPTDPAQVAAGLAAAEHVLDALERMAAARVLGGPAFTRADAHLAPIVGAFRAAPEGAAALARRSALHAWWRGVRTRPSVAATEEGLPDPAQ